MCGGLVVKNTFLCVLDDTEASPASSSSHRNGRAWRKAKSDGVLGSHANLLEEQETTAESLPEAFEDSRLTAWLNALTAGSPEASRAAATEVADSAAQLAFGPMGCQAVERALEVAGPVVGRRVASRLRGYVVEAARSEHAHLVLEAIVYRLDSSEATLIAEELHGRGVAIALNEYGSGVVCQLLDFAAHEPSVVALVDEILAEDMQQLIRHKFGHRVAMAVLSSGSGEQKNRVVAALRAGGSPLLLAKHRFAARVFEHALLLKGSEEEVRTLAGELAAQAGAVVSLACNSFGVNVVRGLLQLPWASCMVAEHLSKACNKLRKDKFGRALVQEFGLARPQLVQ